MKGFIPKIRACFARGDFYIYIFFLGQFASSVVKFRLILTTTIIHHREQASEHRDPDCTDATLNFFFFLFLTDGKTEVSGAETLIAELLPLS